MPRQLLAFDLGAESGRAILGQFDDNRLELRQLHRFATGATAVLGRLYWDVLRFFDEIQTGLSAAAADGGDLGSVGIDTWGVDYGLLDADGALLDNPRNYRDPRTEGVMERGLARVQRQQIFAATGLQFMPINTLWQLLSMRETESPQLTAAQQLLMIPDLLHYFLTGERACEFTNATTTQFYDPRQRRWSTELFDAFDLPPRILPDIIQPGTRLGAIRPEVAANCGLPRIPVVVPATHDTGSAVAAIPAHGGDFAYISSGTWSLMGAELQEPNVSDAALRYNFTNEGGVGGTYRFLKNIMGLWLVQETRRTWQSQGRDRSYAELTEAARQAPAFGALIDPDDGRFMPPGDMAARVQEFCLETGQSPPQSEGAMIRCILESLALKYRWVLERLEEVLGRRLEPIHIVGGGIQNKLLCQLTADAAGRQVVAGPAEATAAGNLLVQALGLGWLDSVEDIREVVRTSFAPRCYDPAHDGERWEQAYRRFCRFLPGEIPD
ncbi:MAG TPA: rhamnulokinase [Candidatus Latescibacteria bacterium]|nr:rhamnulokinase [Candidatus Latescibacterota bacterium]|tara:strand:- start:224 stop:1711 length:1488 start_codon:yes stop_codon:yes gene_type:complete